MSFRSTIRSFPCFAHEDVRNLSGKDYVKFDDVTSISLEDIAICNMHTWEAMPNLGIAHRRLTFYHANVYATSLLVLALLIIGYADITCPVLWQIWYRKSIIYIIHLVTVKINNTSGTYPLSEPFYKRVHTPIIAKSWGKC